MTTTPHQPIDPADPESMCKPDCPRCAELVEQEEELIDRDPFGYGIAGSLGDAPNDAEARSRIDRVERFLDSKFPGWRFKS
jgi:hypothetical protein